ncbi:sporulation protein [Pseudoalteromonas sp. JBTF-M23]|uniref:Sporulation protein n=1 Tax=Pseudoalteromonas caenipelagi TaxID=2726988 RepID=A0A849VBA0_9GAMM|nr:sporulation protein [Pseudoalteromonas caenipelagi]NOU49087.1 sporulation protein [Pseudoalteromonas caenipelagi]
MSFFKKVLGSVGIGAAKVDAVLDHNELSPGEELTGVIKVVGGKVAQEINKIDLDVMCNYTVEYEDDEGEEVTEVREHTLSRFQIKEKFTIEPGEEKHFSFSFDLEEETPITVGHSKTWLETNLDIDMAIDKTDKDYVFVVPTELQQTVIDALQDLGFKLYDADCEGVDSVSFSRLPFVQELEFKTISGDFHGKFDEVEVVFLNRGYQLDVIFEIDRKARGFSGFFKEAFDLDESKVRLVVTEDNLEEVEDIIYDLLEANA